MAERARATLTTRERWAGRLMILSGIVALLASAGMAARSAAFLRAAVPAAGSIARDLGPDASPGWADAHPAVVFTTREGVRWRAPQHTGGRARVGTPVQLLYDPRDPQRSVRPSGFLSIWGGALLALWIGLGFTLLPLVGPRFGLKADFNV